MNGQRRGRMNGMRKEEEEIEREGEGRGRQRREKNRVIKFGSEKAKKSLRSSPFRRL